uniref:Uncharacterized protein n=1 Tax=Arundo donax TaxID=35708 RepID=A0A0A9G5R9_ARUDO
MASWQWPEFASPKIMEFHVTVLLSDILSNIRRASTTSPHFAYVSTRALLTVRSCSTPVTTAYAWTSLPRFTSATLANAGRMLAIVAEFGMTRVPPAIILRNNVLALSY